MLIINEIGKAHNGLYTIQAVGKNLQPKVEINVEGI